MRTKNSKRKRKVAQAASDSEGSEEGPSPAKKTTKTSRTTKKKAAPVEKTEPVELESGWTLHYPNLIYKKSEVEGRSKIAGFDFDGTLVTQKSQARVPKDANDWKFFNKTVKTKLTEFHEDGFKIVIFTNQGGIKKKLDGPAGQKIMDRIDNLIKAVGLDIQVLMAPQDDDYRKPQPGMWKFMEENLNDQIEVDKAASFYVGDMAGRESDIEKSDSDKKFAQNIGISFKVPEDVFGVREGKLDAPTGSGENVNKELSKLFNDLARMSEAEGDNPFAIRSYRKVAGILASYPTVITADNYKDLKDVKGVGKASIEKIGTYLTEGELPKLSAWMEARGETGAVNEEKIDKEAELAEKFL
eukprot:TRINITY_DN7511_c0_g1_i2.p1 TRINITY_DN7511_c0_g1~~TRINITY_DN7511_c0_g1_i2.p1  ORF type:complete len:390 (-),score=79.85 TRINITY_DN7511_c0_g1_i2:293-1363(-)